jgi:type IV secretory pathway VirJ component
MRRLTRFALALALAALVAPRPAAAVDGDRFGEVTVARPSAMRAVVLLFSGAAGWGATEAAATAKLTAAGALVVGIDSRFYLDRLAEIDEACHALTGDAEALGRTVQRDDSTGAYRFPILAGIGEGAALAEAILAQAPLNTFAGAVSVDMPSDPLPGRPPCTDVLHMTLAADPANHPPGPLPGFWTVGLRPGADAERQRLSAWSAAGTAIDLHDLPPTLSDADALVDLIEPHFDPAPPPPGAIADLPLVELPASHPGDTMAVVVSGDGGWRDIDRTVARDLQSDGVSVVGWDSLRYFWHKKTPEAFAHDLAAVLQAYTAKWRPRRIVLVGYSFGADVLPFGFNRLPDGIRHTISMLSLLSLSKAADFEIQVTGWLGAAPSSAALPETPEFARIPGALVQCYYGKDDTDSDCPTLEHGGAQIIETSGSHHFDGDYASLERDIIKGLAERAK